MEHTSLTHEQSLAQKPQLKRYFIVSTLMLVLAILLGQLYQDFHRKQEHLDSKRIHSHHYQAELVLELMNNVLLLRDYDNLGSKLAETSKRELLHKAKQIRVIQEDLAIAFVQRHLAHDDEVLADQEVELSNYVDEFLLVLNEVLASVESDTMSSATIEDAYQQYLSTYTQFQVESERFIEKLSAYLEDESYEHRMVLWAVVFVIMIIVIFVGFIFYRFVSEIVNRDFQLLAEDNFLRKQSEQESTEHAQSMIDQQMKMRSILDSTVDAIITINECGTIDSFNKAAETMFGYPSHFVKGKNVKILMPEYFAIEHDGYLQNYQETREKKIIGIGREVVAKRIDDSEFPVHLSVSEVPESEPKLFTGIIRDITVRKKADKKLKQAMIELRSKQAQLKDEEEIARHVFENITASNNDALAELSSWCVPMGIFSGDLMLSTHLPSGALRIILCDFTGHGLPAALGAVPVSSINHAMAKKGLPLDLLMDELNNKLKSLLPTGIFCCIAGIDIDANRSYAHVWNAGLPEILLVNKAGEIKRRFSSTHLPLGIASYQRDEMELQDMSLETGDRIYIYSDGLTEAENEDGEMFGQERFEQLLNEEVNEDGRLVKIQNDVSNYMGKAVATDDISLLEIKTLS